MRVRTVLAFGAGYVLGTRAGRERYHQLARWFEGIADSSAAEIVRNRSKDLVGSGIATARQTAADGLTVASQQVRRRAG